MTSRARDPSCPNCGAGVSSCDYCRPWRSQIADLQGALNGEQAAREADVLRHHTERRLAAQAAAAEVMRLSLVAEEARARLEKILCDLGQILAGEGGRERREA